MDSCSRENGFVAAVNTVKLSIAAVETVSQNIADVNTVAANIADVNTVADSIVDVNTVAANILDVSKVAESMAAVEHVSLNMDDVNTVSLHMADIEAAVPAAEAAADTLVLVQAEAAEVVNDASYVAQTAAMLFAVSALGMGVIVDADGHLIVTLADLTNIESLTIDNNGHLSANYAA